MTATLDNERWLAETDAFVRRFAARAVHRGEQPADLEDGPAAPWGDPGCDAALEIVATFFPDKQAFRKSEVTVSLASLADRIRTVHAPRKDDLPLVKLARFGGGKTKAGCVRFDANLLQISGVEADYDGGQIGFDQAVETAEKVGLRAIVYTSPSYTPAKPRWRVMAPTSRPLPKERRAQFMDRLNGAFGGVFHRESWTLSQSYYIGYVSPDGGPNPHHRVEGISGEPIDALDELDAIAAGRPGAGSGPAGNAGAGGSEPRGDAELVAVILSGEHLHHELLALAARYIGRGMPPQGVGDTLRGIMLGVPEALRDERWPDRFNSIGHLVASARQNFADLAQQRRAIARITHRLADQHRPAPEIMAAVQSEAQSLGLSPDDALAIANAILLEKVNVHG